MSSHIPTDLVTRIRNKLLTFWIWPDAESEARQLLHAAADELERMSAEDRENYARAVSMLYLIPKEVRVGQAQELLAEYKRWREAVESGVDAQPTAKSSKTETPQLAVFRADVAAADRGRYADRVVLSVYYAKLLLAEIDTALASRVETPVEPIPAWNCANDAPLCRQLNSGWAETCGRCGHKRRAVKTRPPHSDTCPSLKSIGPGPCNCGATP